jgi:sarcosine oxidase gamma subunit
VRPVTAAEPESSHSAVVDAFGVHVEVRVRGDRAAEVLDRLPGLWEFCAAPVGATGEVAAEVVFDSDPQAWAKADADGAVSRPDLEDLLQVLTQRITLSAIDARAGECLMLHAACIADPITGAAAAFVAPGGTGKTTLVSTLGPGRWYVTDETTVVLDDRTVVPYPKPLSVRRTPDSLFKNETPPSAVGLTAPGERVHLAALCLLDRDPQHQGGPTVETLPTLDALVALVPQTSHLPEMARPLQRLAALCESVGGVHRIAYRESADVAGLLDELVGGTS